MELRGAVRCVCVYVSGGGAAVGRGVAWGASVGGEVTLTPRGLLVQRQADRTGIEPHSCGEAEKGLFFIKVEVDAERMACRVTCSLLRDMRINALFFSPPACPFSSNHYPL